VNADFEPDPTFVAVHWSAHRWLSNDHAVDVMAVMLKA
jgi:hypothetical protein